MAKKRKRTLAQRSSPRKYSGSDSCFSEFTDDCDENLMGDESDWVRREVLLEKERETEIFKRIGHRKIEKPVLKEAVPSVSKPIATNKLDKHRSSSIRYVHNPTH